MKSCKKKKNWLTYEVDYCRIIKGVKLKHQPLSNKRRLKSSIIMYSLSRVAIVTKTNTNTNNTNTT